MTTNKSSQQFQVGERVKIRYSVDPWARIVEFRGALGPGGTLVYRLRIPRKPKAVYIEVREDQLVPLPPLPALKPIPVARKAGRGKRKEE
jgi:hypothetical protein